MDLIHAWPNWCAFSPGGRRENETGDAPPESWGGSVVQVALYARYSMDSQRVASIADQFRVCRLHAETQGWRIVEEYSD